VHHGHVVLREERDLVGGHVDAVRAQQLGGEDLGQRRDGALAGRPDEHGGVDGHRPRPVLEPELLVCALGEMRADGDPERERPAVDLDAAGVGRVRRDPDPDELVLLDAARVSANWRSATSGSDANTSR
jgi:hypothetical protein